MQKLVPAVLLCYMLLVAFILIKSGEAKNRLDRNKRYLAFENVTRFYLKFNIKENMVPWNQLFAHTVGFRMNWDVPPMPFSASKRIHRRNVYGYVESLLDKNGVAGFHCVRRAICEIQMITEPTKLYTKLLKIILRKQSSNTDKWHMASPEECDASMTICPFSLLEASRYTDIA